MSTPRRSEFLVEATTLSELLKGSAAPLVLDVRWELKGSQPDAFLAGHVPGAVYVDLEHELCDLSVPPEVAGRHPLPGSADFQAAARRWGVAPDRDVVVMDGGNCIAAARCWWLLRYFGHERVKVLDGGFRAWDDEGRPVETGPANASPTSDFIARPGGMGVLPTSQIPSFLTTGAVLDARAAERYRGEVEPMDPVAGHIPGVRNLPTASLSDERGRFLDAELIERIVSDAGLPQGVPVASSCGSGVNAAHQILALALVGRPALLVPESYSWWCRQPDRSVAVGDTP